MAAGRRVPLSASVKGTWRLILDGPVDGAWNMAVDRAIQLYRQEEHALPTLRLYQWARPTLTLGRFQTQDGIDLSACAEFGVDVVSRPTGGRGVLHDDEVTYSVVAGTDDGVPRGTAASYRHLCEALAEAYRRLGIDAALTSRPRGTAASAACYLHATKADLSLGALKLSGSAQVWHKDTVLQHGSFTLTRDIEREARLFQLDEQGQARLAGETVTLADALSVPPSRDKVMQAIERAFVTTFDIEFTPGELTREERALAETLVSSFAFAQS